ncbi:Pfam:Nse4 (Partial), partial [Seminavis robusta]
AAYNPLTLAAKLKEKLTKKTAADDEKGRFDWTHLGHEAGACFRAVPSRVSFLLGPLQSQTMAKQRRPYKRRHVVKEEEPLEEQVLVPSDGKDCSAILDPAAPIKAVKKSLKEQCAVAETGEIDMVPFLVNPHSFTQTVENFLNFSHLISKGLAGVRKDEVDGNSYIWYIGQQKDEKQKSKEGSGVVHSARQLVMPLTMRDWRKLVDAYNLKEGGLPHRDYSATAAGSVPSEKECNEKVSTVPKGQNQEEQKDGGQEDVAAR